MEEHNVENFFEKIGYPNWWTGKRTKNLKQTNNQRIFAQASVEVPALMDSPFDFDNESNKSTVMDTSFLDMCEEFYKFIQEKN